MGGQLAREKVSEGPGRRLPGCVASFHQAAKEFICSRLTAGLFENTKSTDAQRRRIPQCQSTAKTDQPLATVKIRARADELCIGELSLV